VFYLTNLSATPTEEVRAAIAALESQVMYSEKLLDKSISNDKILANTKAILRKLMEVSKELIELKRLKEISSQN
jgi:hypothetical protein